MKTRETTQEERYEIVKACIDSGLDYGATAEKYKVSYQQVYTWVRKYKELGKPGLEDRRGQRKKDQAPRSEKELSLSASCMSLAVMTAMNVTSRWPRRCFSS